MENWWPTNPISGWSGHGFIKKLKGLKTHLKEWNQHTFEIINDLRYWLTLELKSIDDMEENTTLSSDQHSKRIDINGELLSFVINEEALWRQRCKAQWLTMGDKNTAYFHRLAAAKRRRNTIVEILDRRGISLTNDNEIEYEFIDFYRSLYTK